MLSHQRYSAATGAAPSLLLNAMAFALLVGGPLLVLLWVGISVLGPPSIPGWMALWLSAPGWIGPLLLGLVCGAPLGALAVLRRGHAPPPALALEPAHPAYRSPPRFPDEYELNVPEECLERAADPQMWGKI